MTDTRSKTPAYITKINELAQTCQKKNKDACQAVFAEGLKGTSVKFPFVRKKTKDVIVLEFAINGKLKSLTITFANEDAVIAMPESVNPELQAPDVEEPVPEAPPVVVLPEEPAGGTAPGWPMDFSSTTILIIVVVLAVLAIFSGI